MDFGLGQVILGEVPARGQDLAGHERLPLLLASSLLGTSSTVCKRGERPDDGVAQPAPAGGREMQTGPARGAGTEPGTILHCNKLSPPGRAVKSERLAFMVCSGSGGSGGSGAPHSSRSPDILARHPLLACSPPNSLGLTLLHTSAPLRRASCCRCEMCIDYAPRPAPPHPPRPAPPRAVPLLQRAGRTHPRG